MSVHMPDKYTMFSYIYPNNYNPLKLNNTIAIPWNPKKYPFLMHDCKITDDSNYYIFPIMSSGMGRLVDYIKKIINMPIDEHLNKVGWLVYNYKNESCHEIIMDEYADIFHIADIKHMYKNVHKIYASFVYNFPAWLAGTGDLDIRLKEVIIDLDNYKIIRITDTKLKMDFIHKKGDELIGSCLEDSPAVLKYNVNTKKHTKLRLQGKTVREIIPYDNYLLYFSHEFNKSFLYIANITTGEVININIRMTCWISYYFVC